MHASKIENGLLLAFFLASLVFIYSVAAVLAPFIIAMFIAYMLDPVVDWLELHKLPRTVAVLLIFLLLTVFSISLLVFFIPLLTQQISDFLQQLPDILIWLHQATNQLVKLYLNQTIPDVDTQPLKELLTNHFLKAGALVSQIIKNIGNSTLSVINFIINLLLIPVVTFYLLRDWDKFTDRITQFIPVDYSSTVISLIKESDEALSAFVRGQLMVMLALGCIYSAGLSMLGLNLALLLGLIAGASSIVPYLGVAVGIASSVLAAYFQFDAFWPIAGVLGVFLVGQILETVVLTPLLVGDKIGLHPVIVIFAIMAGGEVAGFTGVLIALPVSAVLVVFVRYTLQRYHLSSLFLSADPSVEGSEASPGSLSEREQAIDESSDNHNSLLK